MLTITRRLERNPSLLYSPTMALSKKMLQLLIFSVVLQLGSLQLEEETTSKCGVSNTLYVIK